MLSDGCKQNIGIKKNLRKNKAAEIANTFEGLIIVFITALVVRAFVLESFCIPTGSMADTLKGAHFRIRCSQCGYRYNYGMGNYDFPQNFVQRESVKSMICRCPSCGHYQRTDTAMSIKRGDQIVVLKWIYQFFEPKRWDVVVFRYPAEPSKDYIKRLIAKPSETVEIIDGDIYIDGKIAQKPLKVQNELWMPVYNNDYQPIKPRQGLFNGHSWQYPFKNTKDSKWRLGKDNPVILCLDSPSDWEHSIVYDTSMGNDFRATYAYDDVRTYKHLPYCSDLKTRFYVRSTSASGRIGVSMSKYKNYYRSWVDFSGEMVLTKAAAGEGKEKILVSKSISSAVSDSPELFEFTNVDHRLTLRFGTERLIYDLGPSPEDAGSRRSDIQPQVNIFGSGVLTLSHIAIFRDIHYIATNSVNRASEGNPFTLGEDEFFVLGDNNPCSADSRLWSSAGVGNNGVFYSPGIVPRDYLVGKAFFVIWPGGFKPFAEFPVSVIPSFGRMRPIYGGSSGNVYLTIQK